MADWFVALFLAPSDQARLEVLKGFFILVSALLTAIVTISIFLLDRKTERNKQRDEAARARRQRQLDLLVSLHAEIYAGGKAALSHVDPAQVRQPMIDALPNPFAIADRTNFVFEGIKNDLSVLPLNALHSVVRYYKHAERTDLLTDGLRDPEFRALERERQVRFVEGLAAIVLEQSHAAVEALQAIEDSLPEDVSSTLNERAATLERNLPGQDEPR